MTDGEGDTSLAAPLLHLFTAALLFVILNFIVGSAWANLIGEGPSPGTSGYWIALILRSILLFGLVPWLALYVSRRFFSRSRINTFVGACVALVAISTVVRLWGLVTIIGTLGPGDGEVRDFALLSIALVLFQGGCSLVAIWLFHVQNKANEKGVPEK